MVVHHYFSHGVDKHVDKYLKIRRLEAAAKALEVCCSPLTGTNGEIITNKAFEKFKKALNDL